MKVIVTGSSSCLARPFLPRLCACDDVKEVIGIDWRPGSFKHHKFTPVRADIRDIKIAPLFAGTDLVYHLAFIVLRSSLGKARNNRELIRDINVNGSKRIFEMASTNKVKRLVHLSSSAVYGAWPDNPYSIDEYQTRRIMPDFSYSEDKNAVEDILDGLENKNPNMIITRLRPHVILGPNCQPF
ncbi:MAG: NAD-dependent epimerase/dehydratase family protein, partial [Gammaproteobacteria bacterium]|nr:NAD-dependent epimerase/dehydratase family protein [Gammaproteobacteria bacterium]